MESSNWPKFILDSIEILVLETSNITSEARINKGLKRSFLSSVLMNQT